MKSHTRWVRGILFVASLLLLGVAAQGAEKELLDMLLGNGALTQEQYDQLLEKEEIQKEDLKHVKVTLDSKGLRVRRADDSFAIKIGGRLHADASGHRGSLSDVATNGTEIRRARIAMKGHVWKDWVWMSEVDFADNGVAVKDFFVGYSGFDLGTVIVGHQKQPYSLAVEMSSNDIPFIERGVDTDLVIPFIDRAIGGRVDLSGKRWHLATGFYGDSVDADKNGGEGWGASARFVATPIRDEDRVLHFGMRGAYRDPNDSEARIRAETTHMSNLFPVDTGTLTQVDRVFLVGPEMAFAVGPFSFGGEYNRAYLIRDGGKNLDFQSWHVEAAWSLTGESRARSYNMSSGEFKRLKAARNFDWKESGPGAWEVAARYAAIDADDSGVNGGRAGVFTLALNWYLNPNIRVMFDWSRILDTNSESRPSKDLDVFQSRVQFAF